MAKVGLLTFHGSHNFGSVMQAYATQRIIEKLGNMCEIINFRMASQKKHYALYGSVKDKRGFLRNLMLIKYHSQRKKRFNLYEDFIFHHLNVSKEFNSRIELEKLKDCYDVAISGSDQIWSEQIAEFLESEEDFTDIYFLSFISERTRKISYASSIGEASADSITAKLQYLKCYKAISTREERGAKILTELLQRNVPVVEDPTFLLSEEDWLDLIDNESKIKLPEKYIFLYSLQGIKMAKKWKDFLRKLGKRLELPILTVTPFFPVHDTGITAIIDAGPLDVLKLFANATYIFTDTFHGTAFSIHFRKTFWVYQSSDSKDARKQNILKKYHLQNQVINTLQVENFKTIEEIDYQPKEILLSERKAASLAYLKAALEQNEYKYL